LTVYSLSNICNKNYWIGQLLLKLLLAVGWYTSLHIVVIIHQIFFVRVLCACLVAAPTDRWNLLIYWKLNILSLNILGACWKWAGTPALSLLKTVCMCTYIDYNIIRHHFRSCRIGVKQTKCTSLLYYSNTTVFA